MPMLKDPALKAAVLFTGLALGFSLLYWLLIVLAGHGSLPFAMGHFDFSLEDNSIPGVLLDLVLRIFGPAVAALITLYLLQGRSGLAGLWRSATRWRVPGHLYALACFGPLAVSAVIVAIGLGLGRLQFAPEQVRPLLFIAFFFLMLFLDGPLGEELGWRGLLLPQLLRRMGPIPASLMVGCIWYLWHLPLFLADGKELHPFSYLINVVGISFVFTWFYLRSGYSAWMAVFLHTTTNYALFLVIKSFHYDSADLAALQYLYDVLVVLAAAAAVWDLRRRGMPAAPSD